jgi:hypothetical protein
MSKLGLSGVRGWRTALVVLVALGLVAALATGAGAASKRSKAAKRVAAAATEFAHEGSARMEGSVTVEATGGKDAGLKFSLPFDGAVDNRTRTGRLSIDLSSTGIPGASGKVQEVYTGGVIYMSLDAFGPKLAGGVDGKHWVKLDLSEYAQVGQSQTQADPTSTLDGLRGVSNDVQDLGQENVRGVDTTHYHATIDVAKALAKVPASHRQRVESALSQFGNGDLPIDVWIGRDGVPRRYSMSMDLTKSGESMHFTEQFDFFDFGVPVDVHVPPASDVANYSDLLAQLRNGQHPAS